MEIRSVKSNYILNLINTISGILFPLITFPYASRILFAEGIGKVQFFDSIVGYILTITSLWIPLYAIREIAIVRHDSYLRSKVAMEILLLHVALTFIAYLSVFVVASTIEKINADIPLFLLLSTTLLFTTIGVFWFYQGIEDFKYITIRAVSIKFFAAIALFTLVKDRNDIMWYAGINVAASVGNNIFNFIRLKKHISFDGLHFKDLQIKRHIAPSLKLFTLNLIVSIYIQLDTVMLGFLKGDAAVGYYTAASKLTRMSLGVITSLGGVLLPRLSNFVSTGRMDEFRDLCNKSLSFTLSLVLPMTVGLMILAHPIIDVFSGPSYAPSALTLQIIASITIFIGFSSLLGMQILYPLGKENIVIIAAASGAIVNLTFNFILIPYFSQYGAAASSVFAEAMVVLMILILWKKYLSFKLFTAKNLNYFIGTIVMAISVYLLSTLKLASCQILIICIPSGVAIYFLFLAIRKDYFIGLIKNMILKKINLPKS